MCYYGTSIYNKDQERSLLDYIVEEAKELGVNPRHGPAVLIARFLKKIENLEKFEEDLEKGYRNGN